MNTCFLLLNNLLTSTQSWGGVATFFLFVLCFIGVHAIKLSSKGYLFYKQMQADQDTTEQDTQPKQTSPATIPKKTVQKRENAPAPVYYLVEKKRIRKQPTGYAEPKRIRFQNEQE